jgi:hypothetical protein
VNVVDATKIKVSSLLNKMQKVFFIFGLTFLLMSFLYPFISKLPFGKLPGDLFFEGSKFSIFFPIVSCIVISILVTLIINIFKI